MAKKNILFRSKKKKAQALLEANRLDEAANLFSQLRQMAPMDVDIWLGLGFLHAKRAEYNDAVNCFRKVVSIQPGHAQSLYNLGVALRDSGNVEKAIPVFEQAILLNPEYGEAYDCLAHAHMWNNDPDRAIGAFQRALEVTPGKAETYSNLGSVYQAKGFLSEAEACYRKALDLNPGPQFLDNLGGVLSSQGRNDEAISAYREGLRKQPNNTSLYSNLLLALNYMSDVNQRDIFEESVAWGRAAEKNSLSSAFNNDTNPDRRLRIGYVSPDFREHSVAYYIEPIIENHVRDNVEVYCYSAVPRPDTVTERLKGLSDRWRDTSGLSADALASQVKKDQIDILVDLAGHTAKNCLLAFTGRPAPVQVTYLGYPNTTGLTSIQYRITDLLVDPQGQDRFYTEKLIRLAGCFLCFKPPVEAPGISELPAQSGAGITFGSFNNLSKINEGVIRLWCEVLSVVPNSHLLVKNPALTDDRTRTRYQALFQAHGCGDDRVQLVGHTPTRQEHLALYSQVDIALDTFPYNGTTTSCEALWMGVPVMTLAMEHHASRVGKSLLESVGLADWVADSEKDFIENTLVKIENLQQLADLRRTMRKRISESSLCDSAGFVSKLEAAYREMWRNWCGLESGPA